MEIDMSRQVSVAIAFIIWVVSYFLLPKVFRHLQSDATYKSMQPLQRINFATINAILAVVLIK